MRKLNNKGFAISAIIYSALILFLLVMLTFLQALSSRRNQLEHVMESAKEVIEYTTISINKEAEPYYVTPYRGRYTISTTEGSADIFLPKDTLIRKVGSKVKFNDDNPINITDNTNSKYTFFNIDTDNKSSSVIISKVYTNKKYAL